MGIPNQMPNIPSQADTQLANFLAAKDVVDRNPGGSKKKWPLIVAAILLAALVVLGVLCFLVYQGYLGGDPQLPASAVSQQAAAFPQGGN